MTLFDGLARNVTVDGDGNAFAMDGIDLSAAVYTTATAGDISTTAGAATALANVKLAITQLAEDRATVGSNVARLNFTNEQLSILRENLGSANSRIKDVDVAEESTQFARYNILVQAGTAMLAQANATPQSALRLLT